MINFCFQNSWLEFKHNYTYTELDMKIKIY